MRFTLANASEAGRMARLRLRLPTGRVIVDVAWPHHRCAPPVLVIGLPSSGDLEALLRDTAARADVLALGVRTELAPPATDGLLRVVSWVCDHATDLGADPARLAVAGVNPAAQAMAAAVVEAASREGWPPIALGLSAVFHPVHEQAPPKSPTTRGDCHAQAQRLAVHDA